MYSHSPSDILVRFSIKTPYWPLSLSYGVFCDPGSRTFYASLDHYVGYHMLARRSDRESVLYAPNGWISYNNLQKILSGGESVDGDPVVSPTWNDERDALLDDGLRMKYEQSVCAYDLLMRTGDRDIYDVSRDTERHWCWCGGEGDNQHGKALVRLRESFRNGEVPPPKR